MTATDSGVDVNSAAAAVKASTEEAAAAPIEGAAAAPTEGEAATPEMSAAAATPPAAEVEEEETGGYVETEREKEIAAGLREKYKVG